MTQKLRIAAFCLLALSACASEPLQPPAARQLPISALQADALTARYRDATSISYSEAHGTQIEYTSADGRAFLWYPGNKIIIPGRWRVERAQQGFGRICFKYPRTTFNPVSRRIGGDWTCTVASAFLALEREYSRGDPLGISQKAKPPFVLPKKGYVGFASLRETGLAE